MRRAFALLVLAALSLAPASAQQFPTQGGLPTPRLTPLLLPNHFGPVTASTSNCLGASGGVTVTVNAEATLPAANTDERVPFQILEGDTVRASGEAQVLRARIPGSSAAPRPRVAVRATFNRTGQVGEGQVRIRIGGSTPSESAAASYSWTCAAYHPPHATVTAVVAPDLAFDDRIMQVRMTRDRRDPIETRTWRNLELDTDFLVVAPNGRVQFWDRTMCRGFDSAWAEIRFEFGLANDGNADLPATVQIEGRVPDAPAWPNPRSVSWPHSPSTMEWFPRLEAARAATGRQSTIFFEEVQGDFYFPRNGAHVFNRFSALIPCGHDRLIEVILDPNNLIPESDETNNRLVLHYDLMG